MLKKLLFVFLCFPLIGHTAEFWSIGSFGNEANENVEATESSKRQRLLLGFRLMVIFTALLLRKMIIQLPRSAR